MPTSTHEQRIKMLEDNYTKLENEIKAGSASLTLLTGRVDAIAQSLERIEKIIDRFLSFLKTAAKWFLGILGSTCGGVLVWYITTHWFTK